MKKLTTSVLAVVLSSSFAMLSAQEKGTDTTNIREIVVTGAMGIKKRQDAVTSANKVVGAQELNQASNPNAAAALTGKVAGLYINTTNSSVNSSMRINLRGNRSISGNTSPIVVVDGVLSNLTFFQQLPPEVIESVNVLKGPQGAALYGPDGSNGAIVVTTKRGVKSSKIQFSLNNSIEVSSVYKLPIYQTKYGQGWPGSNGIDLEGTTFVPYENSSWGPSYAGTLGGQELIQGLPQADGSRIMARYAPVDNHLAKFFKNGVQTQNGISMNIGGSDSYAFLGFSHLENDFMVEGDNMKRNSFNFKGGKKVGNLSIDATVNVIDQVTKQNSANIWANLIQTPTNVDIRRFSNSGLNGHLTPYAYSPYWLRDHLRSNSNSTIVNGTIALNYKINDNINIAYNGNIITQGVETEGWADGAKSIDMYKYDAPYDPDLDGQDVFGLGLTAVTSTYNKSITKYMKYYGDLMVNFNYDLSDNWNLKFNIGNNIQDAKNEYMAIGGSDLQIPGWYHINNVLKPDNFANLSNGRSRERSFAFFANADLAYKDFLFINATARWDKSSVLSVRPYETGVFTNKGYFYPSVGVSFIPTKAFTNFGGNVLNYMKLSASYTRTGNNGSLGFGAIDQVGIIPTGFPYTATGIYGGYPAYMIPRTQVDPNINPEFANALEGNVSLGFLKDRITLDASVFQTKTEDLITNISTSNTSGLSTMRSNIGDMTNKGYEVELGLTPFKSKDFEWNIKGSYSTYKSIVDRLSDGSGGDEIALYSNTTYQMGIYAIVGKDVPMIKGTAYTRDPNGNIVVDENGNPIIDAQYKELGKVNPDYVLGFNTSIRFKNFTLSAVADYRTGNHFYASINPTLAFVGALEKSANFDRTQGYVIPGSVQFNGTSYVANSTPVMNDASYNGVTEYFGGTFGDIAEEHVIDGSAFKIREIALEYKLPKDLISGTFVNSVSMGVFARNPFAWYAKENRNFADPESSNTTGIAQGFVASSQLPTLRVWGFNLNVKF